VAFEAANPNAAELLREESPGLAELHDPGDDDHLDDEQGIIGGDSAPDPWQARNDAWAARQEFADAIGRIRAEYEPLLRPYRQTMRRNPGVVLPELAGLLRERDARIRELTREHDLADAHLQAERDRPGRTVSARERQAGQAAARSLAADLGRSRHLRDDPPDAGRDVHDTWVW
jgi:hypothetical protein